MYFAPKYMYKPMEFYSVGVDVGGGGVFEVTVYLHNTFSGVSRLNDVEHPV